MREESGFTIIGEEVPRITPAHAGRITVWLVRLLIKHGSPPRMREESVSIVVETLEAGITPAHAGRI